MEAQGGAARLFGPRPEALARGGSEEMAVHPQHVFGVHGGELGHRAMIWADADLASDGQPQPGRRKLVVPRIVGNCSLALGLPPSSLVTPSWRDWRRGGVLVSRIMVVVLGFLLSPS
jgi:hypothetical protein